MTWSVKDDEILRAAPGHATMAEVAVKVGRSAGAVRQQAHRLGLVFPRTSNGVYTKPWTAIEDDVLKQYAAFTSCDELAKRLDRTVSAIHNRYRFLSIDGRDYANRVKFGSDHHNWRGGWSGWRGNDWPEFRLLALERDGYTCQDCKRFAPSGSDLRVHHMIPWRLRPINDLKWLVTLCNSCHLSRPEHWWYEIPTEIAEIL